MSVARWGDASPRCSGIRTLEEDAWYFGGAHRAGCRRRPGRLEALPAGSSAEARPCRPGDLGRDRSRLRRMDEYGIWAQVLYPNVAGFGAGQLLAIGDRELMLACVQAYNDFLADYASRRPAAVRRRSWPCPSGTSTRPRRRSQRAAELGPQGCDHERRARPSGACPSSADPHWDPLWAAAQDIGLPVNFHIGSGDMSFFEMAYEGAGRHANYAGFGVQFGMGNVKVIAKLITGGICHRFPELNFVSVESGVGWMPFALARLDWQWKNCGVPAGAPGVRPAAERVFQAPGLRLLLVRDRHGRAGHRSSSAPTGSCTRPTSRTRRAWRPGRPRRPPRPASTSPRRSATCPEPVLRKVLHDNAARLYHLD